MNTRIKMAVAVLAGSLVLAGGYAQAQGTLAPTRIGAPLSAGKHHKGHKLARLAQELGMTPSQKADANSILKNAGAQRRSIRASTAPAAEKKTELKSLHQSTHAQIAALLTPEQKAKWQQRHHRHHAVSVN